MESVVHGVISATVYEATNGHLEKSRQECESVSCGQPDKDCYVVDESDDLMLENGISRLPSTQPVDIQFENISFTASLGFRKGLFTVQLLLFVEVNVR